MSIACTAMFILYVIPVRLFCCPDTLDLCTHVVCAFICLYAYRSLAPHTHPPIYHRPSVGLVQCHTHQVSENGREVAYAQSTMDVHGMASSSRLGDRGNWNWSNASLLYKAPDRGQQTQAFYTDEATGQLSWYACVAPEVSHACHASSRHWCALTVCPSSKE